MMKTNKAGARLLAAGLLSALLSAAASAAITITPGCGGLPDKITWDAPVITGVTDPGYDLFVDVGFPTPSKTSSVANVINTSTHVASPGGTSYTVGMGAQGVPSPDATEGTYCYHLLATSGATPATLANTVAIFSPVCHYFLHSAADGKSPTPDRKDGAAKQLGFNQLWQWDYNLDQDALVDLVIYSSGVAMSTDTFGNTIPDPAATPIKTILNAAPRSSEMPDCSWTNTDFWDSRDSSGTVVANGLYYAYFKVVDPHAAINFAFGANPIRFARAFTVPVDIIRFTQVSFGGITNTAPLANINYTITADASVRLVIAKQGRKFAFDSNGDVQPLNAAGTTIDTSTDSVLMVLTYNRKAGTYADTWNGTDSNGVALSTGIYSVGLSARDAFGNIALSVNGNDGPIQGTIPIDRSANQTSLTVTPAVVSAIAVGGSTVSLSGGTQLTSAFSVIQAFLTGPSGTGANASVVTLAGPNGLVTASTATSISGSTVTFTFSSQSSTGTYTVSVTAKDAVGNSQSPVITTFVLGGIAPSVNSILVSASPISLSGGTTISSGSVSTIAIYLSAASGTGTNATVVTLTDPSGATVAGTTTVTGSTVTFTVATQTSTGTYILSVVAKDTFGTPSSPVATSFVVPAAGAGPTATLGLISGVIAYPNPVKTAPLSVDYTLSNTANIDVAVFNVLGERVFGPATLPSVGAGVQTYTWGLVNDSGAKVGSGVYLFRMKATGATTSGEVIKKVMVIQ